MRTLIALLCLLLCGGAAQAAELPGGVVHVDHDHAVYHDFASGREAALTGDLDIDDMDRAAVSPDGRLLVWFADRYLWGRMLPDGKVFAFRALQTTRRRRGPGSSRLMARGIVNSLAISAGRHYVAYGAGKTPGTSVPGVSWVNVAPVSPSLRIAGMLVQPPGRTVTSTERRLRRIEWDGILGENLLTDRAHLRAGGTDARRGHAVQSVAAAFPSWSPVGEKLAYIERRGRWKVPPTRTVTEEGQQQVEWKGRWSRWGPIITHDCDPLRGVRRYPWEPEPEVGPRRREIDVSLIHCEGLAWKPDGNLTYLSDGDLYSADGKLIARGLNGADLVWVDNRSCLYRKSHGALHLWRDGESTRLLSSVSEGFSYCPAPPFPTEERLTVPPDTHFFVGPLKTRWASACEYDASTGEIREPAVWVDTRASKGGPLQFALTEARSIEEAGDPSGYRYRLAPRTYTDPRTGQQWVKQHCVRVPVGRVVMLRQGQRYAALQPVALELADSETYEPAAHGPGADQAVVAPAIEGLTLRWRYWPARWPHRMAD